VVADDREGGAQIAAQGKMAAELVGHLPESGCHGPAWLHRLLALCAQRAVGGLLAGGLDGYGLQVDARIGDRPAGVGMGRMLDLVLPLRESMAGRLPPGVS